MKNIIKRIERKAHQLNLYKKGLVLYSIVLVSGLVVAQYALFGSRNTEAAVITRSEGIWCRGTEEDPIPGHDVDPGTCIVPDEVADSQNFNLCETDSQYGIVSGCTSGFNTEGICNDGSEPIIIEALNQGDSASCTQLANELCTSVSIDIQCSNDNSLGSISCDPDAVACANKVTETSLAIIQDERESTASTTAYWGWCSGACNSGSSCNGYGTPPVGSMFGCYANNSGGYGCYDVPTNQGGSSCYKDANCNDRSCGCDINRCEAECLTENAGNPGYHTNTNICDNCGQEFTCGCYIPESGTPTPTPTRPNITDTPQQGCPDTQARFRFNIDGTDIGWVEDGSYNLNSVDLFNYAVFINRDTNQIFQGEVVLSGPFGTESNGNGNQRNVPTPWQVGTYNLTARYQGEVCDQVSVNLITTDTPTPTPTSTPTPTVTPPTELVQISGSAYCEDPGKDAYAIDGAIVYIYDRDGNPYMATTDENGNFTELIALTQDVNGDFTDEIAISIIAFDPTNDQVIDATGQSYSMMIPPSAQSSEDAFAIYCNDSTTTQCEVSAGLYGCANNSMVSSGSYANCGIRDNTDDVYTNFDFKFTNCSGGAVTPTPTMTPTPTITVTPTPTVPLFCGEDCDSTYGDDQCQGGPGEQVCAPYQGDEDDYRCMIDICAENPELCGEDICEIPEPGIEIIKEVVYDSDGVYYVGEEVTFRVRIRNTGDRAIYIIEFEDSYNKNRLDFVRVRNAKNNTDITNAFNDGVFGSIDENLGLMSHEDITLIPGIENLEPGGEIVLEFDFIALVDTDRTCNDALIRVDLDGDKNNETFDDKACVRIKDDIPETDI